MDNKSNLIQNESCDLTIGVADHIVHDRLNLVLGENGSGKTTIFDNIAGVNGEGNIPLKNLSIAYKIQNPVIFQNNTVKEVIDLFSHIGHMDLETKTGRMIREKVLSNIFTRKVGQLSGGENQLLFNYGTHLLDRNMYIFDEPTAGVSLSNADYVLKLMADIVEERGKTVVSTLHDVNEIKAVEAHLITIQSGLISFSGSKEQMLDKYGKRFEDALRQLT